MNGIVDSWELADGTTIEVSYDYGAESPRRFGEFGTLITWARGYESPDPNPYESPEDFVACKLAESFTARELVDAIESPTELKALRLMKSGKSVSVESRWAGGWSTELEDDASDFDDEAASDGSWLREELANIAALSPDAIGLLQRKLVVETVFRLDHSGIAYSTRDFRDPWDSGAVGFAFAAREGGMSDAEIRATLQREVEAYSQWANGEVYIVTATSPDGDCECVGGVFADGIGSISAELANELAA